MARGGLRFWHLLVIILLAALLGTALSDLLARTFPDGFPGRVFSAGVTIGTTSPWDLDLRVVQLTFGVGVRLTLLGAIGAGVAAILFFRRV
jgi:hypothetical protein